MTTQMNVASNSLRTSARLAAAVSLVSAAALGAQNTQLASTDTRWTPWVGCWQASTNEPTAPAPAPNKALPVVCIVPAAGTQSVNLVTVEGGVATTERVDAIGAQREVNREGCKGWEKAEFSPDAKRIYLRSEHECTGGRTRTSTGIMSINPDGQWLDVQGVKVGTNSGVRVVHYGRVPVPAALDAGMKATLEGNSLATSTAVLSASDAVTVPNVIEATKRVDPVVVQTWLTQRGQGFGIDAKMLTQLADAKVPSNVIDVMVALSYPQSFAINLAQADGQIIPVDPTRANGEEALRPGPAVYMNGWDPLYSSSSGYYSQYGYRGGLGYAGYYPSSWYTGVPIVITRPAGSVDASQSDSRGRMVKGSGYTRPANGGSGAPRGSTSGGSSSGGGSSGGSSAGETRTAKPRSP